MASNENAGVGAAGPLLVSDVDKMTDMIALNVGALTGLIYAVVPGFVARGTGTIVNVASIAAIAPEVLNPNLSRAEPAARYGIVSAQAA